MMLPQHKESIREHRHGLGRRERPEFDEQWVEELSAVMTFGELGDRTMVGVVLKVDPIDRTIKLQMRSETVWIRLEEIVNVSRV